VTGANSRGDADDRSQAAGRPLLERWVAFWDRREAPTALASIRILVALVLLFDLLDAVSCGAVSLVWAPPPIGAGFGQSSSPPPLAVAWLGASEHTALVLWALAVLSSGLVMFGVAYRVSSWLLVFAMAELLHCQPTYDGIDALLCIVLPLLALSRADAVWSFDAWRRRRRNVLLKDVPAWPRYLLFVQLVWVYFSAAHHRGASWGPVGGFSAIGDVLADPHFARFTPGSLHALYPMMQLGTLLTMLFEFSAPLMPLFTWLDRSPGRGGRFGEVVRRWRIRWVWLSLGVGLHLGIAFSMRLGIFPFGILALYPVFLHPDEIESLLARGAVRPAIRKILSRIGLSHKAGSS
jgi:hypothetical protein